MAQGKLGHDLVAVSPAGSLAQHVPLFDELGHDPMGRAFRDAYGNGNVAKSDAGVLSHAEEHVGVVRQKVPAR